jgi:5-methylcytosine-specific restriction endonuclease McrA
MQSLEKFREFLVQHGAIIEDPTNPWEVLRFRTANGISVIYTNKKGKLTFTGESSAAHQAYNNSGSWRAVDRNRQNLKNKKAKLAARDGKKCFFHGEELAFHELTIEHLLNVSHGGTDHESNLCLACEPCNSAVGNWPLTKKMLWRDQKLNKDEAEIVKTTALTIWQLYKERFNSLSVRNLLSRGAPKTELRNIIESIIGERI